MHLGSDQNSDYELFLNFIWERNLEESLYNCKHVSVVGIYRSRHYFNVIVMSSWLKILLAIKMYSGYKDKVKDMSLILSYSPCSTCIF